MNERRGFFALLAVSALAVAGASGCVERILKIRTDPPGALAVVNDEEVGVTPVEFSFLWYGDYDIILRKAGYETLKTHYRVDAPWYEWPPIDLVAEAMIPAQIRDERELPTFALEPAEIPTVADVVGRATELRDQALGEQAEQR